MNQIDHQATQAATEQPPAPTATKPRRKWGDAPIRLRHEDYCGLPAALWTCRICARSDEVYRPPDQSLQAALAHIHAVHGRTQDEDPR